MGEVFREAIAPIGLVIDKVEYAADQILMTGRSRFRVSICPNCCRPSARVHSRYHRTLADLPSHGRPVRITLVARRFRCATSRCTTRIATIEAAVPALVVVRNLADRFHRIIRQQKDFELATWIDEARKNAASFVCQWLERRLECGEGGYRRALVQRANGRTDHEVEARQTPDVRTRQARFAAGQADATSRSTLFIAPKSESEPFFDADRGSRLNAA